MDFAKRPELFVVDSLGRKLSKASNNFFKISLVACSARSPTFSPILLATSPASFATLSTFLPTSLAVFPALSIASPGLKSRIGYLRCLISLKDRLLTSPDWISSELGAE